MGTISNQVADARWIDLAEGQTIEGLVVKLPARGQVAGTRLVVEVGGWDCVSIAAVARRGWSVLERLLKDRLVAVGDEIAVTFVGWRTSADGERRYRDVRVTVIERAA